MSNLTFMQKLFFAVVVGLGGVIGTLMRFFTSLLFNENVGSFPWDTVIVNLSGSFLLAFLLSITTHHIQLNKLTLTFFTTGVIGSFTTFSTIMIDFHNLFHLSLMSAVLYFAITMVGGLSLTFLGLILGKGFD